MQAGPQVIVSICSVGYAEVQVQVQASHHRLHLSVHFCTFMGESVMLRQMAETFVSWSIMSHALGTIVEFILRAAH